MATKKKKSAPAHEPGQIAKAAKRIDAVMKERGCKTLAELDRALIKTNPIKGKE